MKRRTLALLLLGSFLLGAATAGYVAWLYCGIYADFREMFAVAWSAERSHFLYVNADAKVAQEALLYHLDVLDRARAARDAAPDSIIDSDTALTYGRLALLEERQGNEEEAKPYLAEGVLFLARAGVPDPTPQDLLAHVRAIDGSLER